MGSEIFMGSSPILTNHKQRLLEKKNHGMGTLQHGI